MGLSWAGIIWCASRNHGSLFVISYALLHLSHRTKHMWQLHSLRFRDEESDGAYSGLDLETKGSDPDYKSLSSEEMCSFGQNINIPDSISLSSPELHVPFYEWRIVVGVTYLRVKVCNQGVSNMLRFTVKYEWANTKDQRWTYKIVNGALGIPSWAKMDLYLAQKQRNYVISMIGLLMPADAD